MKLFTKHPSEVGESYWQHLSKAISFGLQMIVAGIVCLIHAVFPFLFIETASKMIHKLHEGFLSRNK